MVSRYGVKIRSKEAKVLEKMRQKHECPKCGKKSVKRKGNALWACGSCGVEFAGGAYLPRTDIGTAANKAISSVGQ